MQIIKAEAIPVRIPLKRPFTIAVGSLTHSNHVLVRLVDEEGREGWGETSTFLEVYGYDQKALYEALSRHLLPAVVGLSLGDFAALNQRLDRVMPFNLMAKAGVDLAAHDLASKAAGLPLSIFLGGRRMEQVPMIGAVDMVPPGEAAAMARDLLSQGHATLKVKIGRDPGQDLARVAAVREAAGDGLSLRVDGNASYDRRTALKVFSAMDHMGLEWIEQPLPAWDLEGHAELARRLATPIALDESIYTLHDAMAAIKLGACSVVNVKLVRCGGVYRSRQIVSVCQAAGVVCFLGGVLETTPGEAAGAHFYAATPNLVSAAEFRGVDHYLDDISAAPLPWQDGCLTVPSRPGLGVEVDPEKLARYRVSW